MVARSRQVPGKEVTMVDSTSVRFTQALAPYRQGLWQAFLDLGYTPLSAGNLLRLAAHLSRWLDEHGERLESLSPALIESFLNARREAGYTHFRSVRAVAPILSYLEEAGVVSRIVPVRELTAREQLIRRYHEYLRRERGLTEGRARAYCDTARRFLQASLDPDDVAEAELRLNASHVTAFLLEATSRYATGMVANVASALRSVLRYLYLEGRLAVDLSGAVPATTGSRRGGLPKALERGEMRRLLRTCDRRRHVGRRNYAVLLLMTRLGLRAGEVAALELDDIDWRHGEFRVRGKGNRHERLPLPGDVGAAIAAYLRRSRLASVDRHLLLTVRAPARALSAMAIKAIANTALTRAGLPTGSHRLRHTAATQMLAAGASLDEIAQVLRHRSHATTAIYAKVNRSALITVARPWPGAVS